ncbi:radical SAM protein [Putridiphycobacter roseus]|uniref:Radical SAM protein n=1 Tax=Putridiphycobacter roseus TaxID=2219161 RepID=A0A2W1MYX5_9FLAO|nr:radical SAM protein [Putridiphycobacter roseus]PZE15761.1 radical SAM protein [Putridiphycobacter roseus]
MTKDILLITPPFTQLNTPYPATAYLKGFLNTQNISVAQLDLGIDVILNIFSTQGLIALFEKVTWENCSEQSRRFIDLKEDYIGSIDATIHFLQGQNPTLANAIVQEGFLPEGPRFNDLEDLDWAFGQMGQQDKAKHLATLYLEDISDFIVENIDPLFGFSRYAERMSQSANNFDEIYDFIQKEDSYIHQVTLEILGTEIRKTQPQLVALSIPFPGNLVAGLKCAQHIKKIAPNTKIVMGGGYPNTELRSIKDPRVFEWIDFITLDDGEAPILQLIKHVQSQTNLKTLKRTLTLVDGLVTYFDNPVIADFKQEDVGTPDYSDLKIKSYISVIEVTNPMHSLWSDGRWNKLTLAHGCYWRKCTFCDISLSYIKDYEPNSAAMLVDRMEELIAATGETGFHFVDEAAPPSLMRELALTILHRKLSVSWWTNIRFEKSFSADLCQLLKASGCIAVSGGIEVASDRLLKLIDKGVDLQQLATVTQNFSAAGILVHGYLMYGFPTQTDAETINSLEVVRQLFEANLVQSGFWHQFAMTAHSPIGINPERFKVLATKEDKGSFANNDIPHQDTSGVDHQKYSQGLKTSLHNYMRGTGFDLPLKTWFDFHIKPTTLAQNFIELALENSPAVAIKPTSKIVWLGPKIILDRMVQIKSNKYALKINTKNNQFEIKGKQEVLNLTALLLEKCHISNAASCRIKDLDTIFTPNYDLSDFLGSKNFEYLNENGLLIL